MNMLNEDIENLSTAYTTPSRKLHMSFNYVGASHPLQEQCSAKVKFMTK